MRISERYAAQSPLRDDTRTDSQAPIEKARTKNPGTITLRCSVENILLVSSSLYVLLLKVSHVQKAFKVKTLLLGKSLSTSQITKLLSFSISFFLSFFLSQVPFFSLSRIALRFLCTNHVSQVEMNQWKETKDV